MKHLVIFPQVVTITSKTEPKQLESLIVKQHETSYPDTLATGKFAPPHCPGKTI